MKEAGPELQLCEKRCTTQQTRSQEDLCFLITQNEQTFTVFPSTFISSLLLKPPLRKASDADHHCSSTSKLVTFKEFTMLKPNFSNWSYSTCNNNDMLFRKRIVTGSSIHYKSMPRMRQEGEGSHLFSSICNSSFDWNMSNWTILGPKKYFKSFCYDNPSCSDQEKKKNTLCLLLPAPFLSNGLLCWRM